MLREEEGGGDVTTDGEGDRTSMSSRGEEINSSWVGLLNYLEPVTFSFMSEKVSVGYFAWGFVIYKTYSSSCNRFTNRIKIFLD